MGPWVGNQVPEALALSPSQASKLSSVKAATLFKTLLVLSKYGLGTAYTVHQLLLPIPSETLIAGAPHLKSQVGTTWYSFRKHRIADGTRNPMLPNLYPSIPTSILQPEPTAMVEGYSRAVVRGWIQGCGQKGMQFL